MTASMTIPTSHQGLKNSPRRIMESAVAVIAAPGHQPALAR
jgi:hypothetical protein